MPNGSGRRKDNNSLEKEFVDFKIEIKSFIASLQEWQNQTKQYRIDLCSKIDKIDMQLSNHITDITASFNSLDKSTNSMVVNLNEKIGQLPCRERSAWYQSMNKQVKWLWMVSGGAIAAIVVEWIKKK
jgi:seryl-tRNA synthetase